MKRYLSFAFLLALLASGCSGGDSAAATVNGLAIEAESINALVGSPDSELTDAQFLSALTAVVQWHAISDAATDEFDISPTEEEIAAHADLIFAAQAGESTREEFLALQQVSEEGFALYAAQLLIGEQILAELEPTVEQATAEEAQALFDEDPESWTLVCAAHILVETEEEALDVQARLAADEAFADVAAEVSLDTGSGAAGGDLGCSSPTQWVDEFAAATLSGEIGVVLDPVESQFGFHVIRVDSRTEATTEELQTALSDERLATVLEEWYLAAVAGADVDVDPEYGTWETDPVPTIVAPAS